MITLKDFMDVVDYRITEGGDYYGLGSSAYSFTYWNGIQDGCSISIVFSTESQEVLIAEACDYSANRAYRLVSPHVKDQTRDQNAWDDIDWTDLEVDADWLEKARAIVLGKDYDTRITIQLDFTDNELLKYMTMAHERDMTFNQFVEEALRHAIEEAQRDPSGFKTKAENWKKENSV
jgi:hypothetical protein